MFTVSLHGGLGNQLFQLAAGETIASETNRQFYLEQKTSPVTHHTTQDYFTSILRPWLDLYREGVSPTTISEPSYARHDWNTHVPASRDAVKVNGYFQNWTYISPTFVPRLNLPSGRPPLSSVFLHIRGGDYVANSFHNVHLEEKYYPWAVSQFPPETRFLIFTNDRPYAESLPFLKTIAYSFADGDELDALDQMRRCSGGICANSTFSWWGAYLNPNRKIIVPSKWFDQPGMYVRGYFVPGWTIGPV